MSGHSDLVDAGWRKSSRSSNNADCVEVAAVGDRAGDTPGDRAGDTPGDRAGDTPGD